MSAFIRLSLLLLFTSIATLSFSQKSEKYLLKKTTEFGKIYFVKPIKLKAKRNVFEPDYTYQFRRNTLDTLTVNASIFSKDNLKGVPEKITYTVDNKTFVIKKDQIRMFYAENKKGTWESRISFKLPTSFLSKFGIQQHILIEFSNGSFEVEFDKTSILKDLKAASETIQLEIENL